MWLAAVSSPWDWRTIKISNDDDVNVSMPTLLIHACVLNDFNWTRNCSFSSSRERTYASEGLDGESVSKGDEWQEADLRLIVDAFILVGNAAVAVSAGVESPAHGARGTYVVHLGALPSHLDCNRRRSAFTQESAPVELGKRHAHHWGSERVVNHRQTYFAAATARARRLPMFCLGLSVQRICHVTDHEAASSRRRNGGMRARTLRGR